MAGLDPRGLFVVAQRLQVHQPRQEDKYLRRGEEHHRTVSSQGTQPIGFVQGPAPVAGGILQHPERRPFRVERMVYQLQPGTADAHDRLRR